MKLDELESKVFEIDLRTQFTWDTVEKLIQKVVKLENKVQVLMELNAPRKKAGKRKRK